MKRISEKYTTSGNKKKKTMDNTSIFLYLEQDEVPVSDYIFKIKMRMKKPNFPKSQSRWCDDDSLTSEKTNTFRCSAPQIEKN